MVVKETAQLSEYHKLDQLLVMISKRRKTNRNEVNLIQVCMTSPSS